MRPVVLLSAALLSALVPAAGDAGAAPDYVLRTATNLVGLVLPTGPYEWRGVAPADIDGDLNPDLFAEVGVPLTITIRYDDLFLVQSVHNIAVWNEDQNIVAGPTDDIGTPGQEATLTWVPTDAGLFNYVCVFHPGGMTGTVEVA